MRFEWGKLLCSETLKEKEKTPSSWVDYPMDPFEEDYREIINSVSFRRLQDKAQMYQLCKGEYVRTRLTHSLEVSTIAKQLGMMMLFNDKWNGLEAFSGLTPWQSRAIPTVLACAGLLHDMGNPPFGHEGEYAIGKWFSDRLRRDDFKIHDIPIRDFLTEKMKRDLENYEGNAQVIRMLSKCKFPSEEQEANVTFATISTLVKYPVNSMEMKKDSPDLRMHKFGFYESEEKIVRMVREKTGVCLPESPYARNPLTYFLEAADDIAYVASDIEDAITKNTTTIHDLISFVKKSIAEIPEEGDEMHQLQVLTVEGIFNNLLMRLEKSDGTVNGETMALHTWTNYLRNWLMYIATTSFVSNSEAIMNGTYCNDLLDGSHHKYTVELMKKSMQVNVYPKLGDIHIEAHVILVDLLNKFAPAVINWDTDAGLTQFEAMYIDTIPERFKKTYFAEKTEDEVYNLYLRFRTITDFIGSMSDGHALELYQKYNAYIV